MRNRFGENAEIHYRDLDAPGVREEHADTVERIETAGLLLPVTVVDGAPTYDGAISYPAILRAVQERLTRLAELAE